MTNAGYAALTFTGALSFLVLIAAVAMLNGLGRDRGPASTLEQALPPSATSDEHD